MQGYVIKAGLNVCSHQLRHIIIMQMLSADAATVTFYDLPGQSRVMSTQRYRRVSNQNARRDYYKAIQKVLKRYDLQKKA